MALANNVERVSMLRGFEISVPCVGADVFYKGALVNLTTAGKVIVAADTASHIYGGMVVEYVNAGAADVLVKIVRSEIIELPFTGAAVADIGDDFFATADDTIAKTAINTKRMGVCVGFVTSPATVLIDTAYAENA